MNFRTDFCAQISRNIFLNPLSVPSAYYTFIKIQCSYVEFCIDILSLGLPQSVLSKGRVSLFKMYCLCFCPVLLNIWKCFQQDGTVSHKQGGLSERDKGKCPVLASLVLQWDRLSCTIAGANISPHFIVYWGCKCGIGLFWTNSCHCHLSVYVQFGM